MTTTTEVENFPGFPAGLSGPDLMDKMREQSLKHGTTIHTETIVKVDFSVKPFKVWTEDNNQDEDCVLAHSIIIATGATAKRVTY